MKSKLMIRISFLIACGVLAAALPASGVLAGAQAPKAFRGTITAISGSTLTVKTDADEIRLVEVPATAVLKRVAPGQTDLKSAETIQFSDLAAEDRVLVTPYPSSTGPIAQALRIVAIKQSDLALKQQKDREDWQRRGLGGLVKSVDAAAGVIVLSSGSGATAKTITVKTTKTTILRRYVPPSVRTVDAREAPIEAIRPGDQLRARGTKNADGTEIAAEEVVSGTFRNISGMIASLDAAGSTLVVKDLATKKPVTIHVTAEAQMRRLPDRMAQALAARLKGTAGSGAGGGQGQWSGAGGQGGQWSGSGGQGPGGGQNGQWGGHAGGGDPEQMLSRAPAIQLGDLQKGEAVMLVAIESTAEVTAVTLLAGVEPLLEAPTASRDLLANWSVGASAPDVAQ
jgi:uncharacterized membrane protein YgcG